MIDRNGFVEYLSKVKKKGSNEHYPAHRQEQYLDCMDILRVDGLFDSIYDLDNIDDELALKIRNSEDFKKFHSASQRAVGASFTLYVEYLNDPRFEKRRVDCIPPCKRKTRIDSRFLVDQQMSLIMEYFKSKGFHYRNDQLINFYLALKTKPFVLLAGISGTGKTRLARLFAEAVGATQSGRYLQVAVRPDWSDSSDIFGYKNLKGEFEVGHITKFIAKAMTDINNPYFLVLDEMNLARVEYYFSDFFSLLETRDLQSDGTLRSDAILKDEIQSWVVAEGLDEELFKNGIYLPQNLYVIGTVNMDESTFPFSKKVLDRAITIEFNDVELKSHDVVTSVVQPLVDIDNSYFLSSYRSMIDVNEKDKTAEANDIIDVICVWNDILKKAHLNIGYRVRNDILFYALYAKELNLALEEYNPLDYCMMQKILPRIQGSSNAIETVLEGLDDALSSNEYPLSKEKIHYMLERLKSDGFTAFWL